MNIIWKIYKYKSAKVHLLLLLITFDRFMYININIYSLLCTDFCSEICFIGLKPWSNFRILVAVWRVKSLSCHSFTRQGISNLSYFFFLKGNNECILINPMHVQTSSSDGRFLNDKIVDLTQYENQKKSIWRTALFACSFDGVFFQASGLCDFFPISC